ncbi:hypothetical protein HDE_02801 [Halotydeus destructor]|nr:hypothetical protein HDE_02801 [Halotydeus destructor]
MDSEEPKMISWKNIFLRMSREDIKNELFEPYKKYTSLASSLTLQTEFLALKKVLLRVAVRLRNGRLPRLIKQTSKYLHDFLSKNHDFARFGFITQLNTNPALTDGVKIPNSEELDHLLLVLVKSAELLERSTNLTLYAFGECMPWMRLGHLVNHLLATVSSLSRLNVISKALMVHVCDLYNGLFKLRQNFYGSPDNTTVDSIDFMLVRNNIQPKLIQVKEDGKATAGSLQKDDTVKEVTEQSFLGSLKSTEDYGVVVSREDSSSIAVSTVKTKKWRKRQIKKTKKAN